MANTGSRYPAGWHRYENLGFRRLVSPVDGLIDKCRDRMRAEGRDSNMCALLSRMLEMYAAGDIAVKWVPDGWEEE